MIRMTSNDYYDFLEKVLERYEELSEKVYFIGGNRKKFSIFIETN